MGLSGGGSKSSGEGGTGQISSLSFVPALLANAFFGSGIGLDDGGFTMTGLGDFNSSGKIKGGRSSSLMDPFGLSQIIGSNPLLTKRNPFSQNNPNSPINNPFSSFTQGGGGGGDLGGLFGDLTGSPASNGMFGFPGSDLPGMDALFGGFSNIGRDIPMMGGLFGKDAVSPEDQARARTSNLMGFSPGALGMGQGGMLNPFDLVSNLTDLANPNINPGIGAGLRGLGLGEVGSLLGSDLLFGDVNSTLREGLETGFKPDLQPVINEASRAFFQDIVPQLGQSNVAMQEGVGPFSTDLTGQLAGAGATMASQLGSLEVENQNRAADRKGEFLGLSGIITDMMMNAPANSARNLIDLGEQLATQGTRGGRQATLLQLLAGQVPSGPIQASSSSNRAKSAQGGIGV